ncbi:hypothetical protein SESBI_05554 [Sesbania bispinosa]|nr:hypothetical protein SESBI_05554 [Sesbania bispinosa]
MAPMILCSIVSTSLACPMRAFSGKASSKDNNKRDANSEKSTTPNLSVVPSLLIVRG